MIKSVLILQLMTVSNAKALFTKLRTANNTLKAEKAESVRMKKRVGECYICCCNAHIITTHYVDTSLRTTPYTIKGTII